MSNVEALWAPPPGGATAFPCVDCGLMTGNFCDGGISVDFDHCFAAERVPKDYANIGGVGMQRTPLCSYCETRWNFCRFCRKVKGCTPASRQVHWSGVPEHLSRTFTNERAKQAVAAEWFARNFLRQQQRYEAIGRSRLKALT
jgi:hypothetical protein